MNRSIRYFESQEIVRRRYHHLHGRYPNAAKARSIALHVEQGVNFIKSATRAPISIRPLLQFYGVAALARAVTIFRDRNRVESTAHCWPRFASSKLGCTRRLALRPWIY